MQLPRRCDKLDQVLQPRDGRHGNADILLHLLHRGSVALAAFLSVEGDDDSGRLGVLPPSDAKEALTAMTEFIVERRF